MLTSKELMLLEDYLSMAENNSKTFQHLGSEIQCQQTKQLFQQVSQKCQQSIQTVAKHLGGQSS